MFQLREQLITDFAEYIQSFLKVRDEGIREWVESELNAGALWPEPLLALNPTFRQGPLVDELVEQKFLHPQCGAIFRRGKTEATPTGVPLRLFRHQEQALHKAQAGRNYVLTTGTGSGKSLSYILPIVDRVLKEGTGKGVRAVVVYPMNALANSQLGELEKYLSVSGGKPPVSFARYTGQEKMAERDQITQNPPDIILTNFMMLELMLSRPYEKALIDAMSDLKFLVLDELHTYRGRQGADVALLIRRLRERTGAPHMQCVGTSATMATEGTSAARRQAVASVAAKLFGDEVSSEDVISETLVRLSAELDLSSTAAVEALRSSLGKPVTTSVQGFREHPLTRWLEGTVGLTRNDEGELVRAQPSALKGPEGVAGRLAQDVDVSIEQAERAIQDHLLAASRLDPDPITGMRPFAFRLHQFLSPGVGIFATIAEADERFLSLDGQRTAPDNPSRVLFPLAFCRSCGQHYYLVTRGTDEGGTATVVPRRLSETAAQDDTVAGFLFLPDEKGFPDLDSLVPEDWMEESKGGPRVKKAKKKCLPTRLQVSANGAVGAGTDAWFLESPFCLCVQCRESFSPREGDISKLSVLGLQGRSTATTTLSLSTLAYLRLSDEVSEGARKLLSFTDNRQDASLQAGHLNDFVEVGTLRSAIYAAAKTYGSEGIPHDEITLEVERQLGLEQDEYAAQPSNLPSQLNARRKALRDVFGYRVYRDLRRGWRINAPNLEQVGLLKIEYPDLSFICASESYWQGTHQALLQASPQVREAICRNLLERLRKRLAIRVRYLTADDQEVIRNASLSLLKEPWGLSEDEASRLDPAAYAWLIPSHSSDERSDLLLTPRSAFAHFLRQPTTFKGKVTGLKSDDLMKITENLLSILGGEAALVSVVHPRKGETAYQLNAEAFRWVAIEPSDEHRRTHNAFFERFYRERAAQLKGMYAREHTAQVPSDERERREGDFRAGRLPILFCSPTMELGVDISDLNVVNMRNVPPTPANYAQRSGRAGRSGQPALVYTYCTAGSPHDQYYFRRQEQMVAGAVAPPRLDVANEDLVRAHVHAIWLGHSSLDLGQSLADVVLDVSGEDPTLALRAEVLDRLNNQTLRDRAHADAEQMLAAIETELARTTWYSDTWLEGVIGQIKLSLDLACDRWRTLYRSARAQQAAQNRAILDNTFTEVQRAIAKRLRAEAENQMALLKDVSSAALSDFYVYRYLASEGFLPGYNFPRLPLSAYLPGRRGRSDYLSRPRFLAISEFGPGAVVYHEGSRYVVDRVMLPAGSLQEGGQLMTTVARLCSSCGYLHDGPDAATVDLCERCEKPLTAEAELDNLFRLESVNLRRRDRITCDEEERMRQGYELRTGLRFKGKAGEEQCVRADILLDGEPLARLTYAQAATIWRVNVGWNRRRNKELLGYTLDYEKGRWVSSEQDGANALMEESGSELSKKTQRVIPYVEDRRNALIFEWCAPLSLAQSASLQAALKSAIQAVYQLEDSELAAEPLPSSDCRQCLLFFEAAEGGAGVLHRLLDDSQAIQRVARAALELCHYHPETLEDERRHPRAKTDCSTACYDCLMSYGNQRDHPSLDRREIVDLLAALRDASVEASSGPEPRAFKLKRLLSLCGSELERSWLQLLEDKGLTLPTYAQHRIESCKTQPDFAYLHGATKIAVYVDGPPHDYPERQKRDAEQELALICAGWIVHRFHHLDDWEQVVRSNPSVYGEWR